MLIERSLIGRLLLLLVVQQRHLSMRLRHTQGYTHEPMNEPDELDGNQRWMRMMMSTLLMMMSCSNDSNGATTTTTTTSTTSRVCVS